MVAKGSVETECDALNCQDPKQPLQMASSIGRYIAAPKDVQQRSLSKARWICGHIA